MDPERFRELALALPRVAETQQWGDNLVYWAGDKRIGGKMFALLDLGDRVRADGTPAPLVSFYAGAERFAALLDREGIIPAPYLARAHWVAAERWDALDDAEWKESLAVAHNGVRARLTRRTQALLDGTASDYRRAITAAVAKAKAAGTAKRPR